MLGYEVYDQEEMVTAVQHALSYIPPAQTEIYAGLIKAQDFLQGLWAEGYFDQGQKPRIFKTDISDITRLRNTITRGLTKPITNWQNNPINPTNRKKN